MKTNILPLKPNTFYHIYNRGINGETIFKQNRNYSYFLEKYDRFLSPVADTHAYCLLGNHFHFLIRTKSEDVIMELKIKMLCKTNTNPNIPNVNKIISQAFASLFKSYAQSINKAFNRTGALFEEPFRRIEISSESYFRQMVHYIHFNPQKHGFVNDFRDYPHSSYSAFTTLKNTKLKRETVLAWFGDRVKFLDSHAIHSSFQEIKDLILEE